MRFHRAIIDAAASPRLSRAYGQVQAEIQLCMVQLRPHYERPSQVADEHTALLAAIVDADPQRADQLFREHLSRRGPEPEQRPRSRRRAERRGGNPVSESE